MDEDEVQSLRATNQRLSHELQILKSGLQHLDAELGRCRGQLEGERQLMKSMKTEIALQMKFVQETHAKKYERLISELKAR